MQTVWKFPVPRAPAALAAEIKMPGGANILKLAMQDGEPTLWALVDPRGSRRVVISEPIRFS